MIFTILIPFIAGALIKVIRFKKRVHKEIFLESLVILNSILVFYLIFTGNG